MPRLRVLKQQVRYTLLSNPVLIETFVSSKCVVASYMQGQADGCIHISCRWHADSIAQPGSTFIAIAGQLATSSCCIVVQVFGP